HASTPAVVPQHPPPAFEDREGLVARVPTAGIPPDLAQVAAAWHDLSKHIREAIVSLAQLKGNT
ncbi:MAG: hypothetical protein NTX87_15565, partial [Planctomycetota bacterium]|nr:hypothetical protein [Planctomycetota bacterium]